MFKRKYNLDETIFENIKTEAQAYWLGFFTADGSITENKIRLSLGGKDYEHLQLWKKFTGWNGKDYYHKDTKAWEVYFRSSKIKKDLSLLGVTPRKTFSIRFNSKLNKRLIPHYVRGIFDADGCITKQTRKVVKLSGKTYSYDSGEFSIEGNKMFIIELQERIFCSTLHLPKTSLNYSHKRISRLRYGGIDQLAKIYSYLYKDASIFMSRKKMVFEDILLRRERLSEWTLRKRSEATVRTAW